MDIIRIRPALALRREFAAWAVAQLPKVRTCGPDSFAVPAALYVQMPEALLIGAAVDGQSYVPVADTAADPEPPQAEPESEGPGLPAAPTGAELLGVATPEAFTSLSDIETTSQGGEQPAAGVEAAPRINCPDCERQFTGKRGLRAHRRQVHGEGATDAG